MSHYDPTDPEQVASAKLLDERKRQRDLSDLRAVLAMPEGRRWLWRMLEIVEAFTASYDDNPLRMAFAEGRRSVGLRLLAEMQEAAPSAFAVLIGEAWGASQITPTTEEEDS